jgi:hypothetical protein
MPGAPAVLCPCIATERCTGPQGPVVVIWGQRYDSLNRSNMGDKRPMWPTAGVGLPVAWRIMNGHRGAAHIHTREGLRNLTHTTRKST